MKHFMRIILNIFNVDLLPSMSQLNCSDALTTSTARL